MAVGPRHLKTKELFETGFDALRGVTVIRIAVFLLRVFLRRLATAPAGLRLLNDLALGLGWVRLIAAEQLQVAAFDENSGVLDQARGLAASRQIFPFDGRKTRLL